MAALARVSAGVACGQRGIHRWVSKYLRAVQNRRKEVGPQPDVHRSAWSNNWNYDAELFAFSKRLNEEFNSSSLRTVFTHRSYIEQEEAKRLELGIPKQDVSLNLTDNQQLVKSGSELIDEYVKAYLRHTHVFLPEEGICAVHRFLVSEDVLSNVAACIGISDLMLCSDFPPLKSTLSDTLKALVGALLSDKGQERAEIFVQDFIVTQLVGRDINELWEVTDPLRLVSDILEREGRSPPESRLLREAGKNTILSVYVVGLYCDKRLIGSGPGETVATAEEMAARDALSRLFGTAKDKDPLPLGKKGHQLKLTYGKPNLTLANWTRQSAQQRAKSLQ